MAKKSLDFTFSIVKILNGSLSFNWEERGVEGGNVSRQILLINLNHLSTVP